MEEFLKTQTSSKLKDILVVYFASYDKIIQQLFMYYNRTLEGYTHVQRLAYIVHKREFDTMKELNSIFRDIKRGLMYFNSKQFEDFLLKHSGNLNVGSKLSIDVVYDDDFSDSDSCVEQISLG